MSFCFVAGVESDLHAFLIVFHFDSHAAATSDDLQTVERREPHVCCGGIKWRVVVQVSVQSQRAFGSTTRSQRQLDSHSERPRGCLWTGVPGDKQQGRVQRVKALRKEEQREVEYSRGISGREVGAVVECAGRALRCWCAAVVGKIV